MANLDKLQALGVPSQKVSFYRGTVVLPTGASLYAVSLNGNILPVSASDSVSVSVGDSVLVAIVAGSTGQAEALVLARLSTAGLHPAIGTVKTVPPSSPTITVTGADGTDYTCYFPSSYTPAVSDNVEMQWVGPYPYVSKAGATPAPPTSIVTIAPPPAPVSSGTAPYSASDSSTYWGPGGWGSWAGGAWIYQGDYGSGPLTGAYFYGGAPSQLQGRTISGGRVTLGPRMGAGSYNNPLTVNIYSHSSPNRPGGNVSLLNGPTQAAAQPWQGLTTYELTQAQAQDVVNGGGIAIYGGSYMAFQGIAQNAQAGLINIDWSR